jgi:hypothetical protein
MVATGEKAIPCPEGFMVNTGTTPVLPQDLVNNFWSGMTYQSPPEMICYPTIDTTT